MPKRALITGITGQDGSYLAELYSAKDTRFTGFVAVQAVLIRRGLTI